MNRRQRIIVSVTGIFLVALILIGFTYAYFLTRINGNPNDTSISVTTANLVLDYADGNGVLLPYGVIQPGDPIKFYTAKVGEDGKYLTDDQGNYIPNQVVETKTFSVENKGNASVNYAVILDNFSVTYASDAILDTGEVKAGDSTNFVYPKDFKLEITCSSNKDNGCIGNNTTLPTTNARLLSNNIAVGEKHEYELKMIYEDSGINQSADMNKTFTGRINIIDIENTVDIEGKIANYTPGDFIETNSVKRTSNIDSEGNYRILGLEPDKHTFKIMGKDNTVKLTKTLNITKGQESSVNGTDIVSTNTNRTFEVNVGTNNVLETVDKSKVKGITFSALKATTESNQINGLILFESFNELYDAIDRYFGVTSNISHSVVIPEVLEYTVYGNVTYDYDGTMKTLLGTLYGVNNQLSGQKPLKEINLKGGNDTASITVLQKNTTSTTHLGIWVPLNFNIPTVPTFAESQGVNAVQFNVRDITFPTSIVFKTSENVFAILNGNRSYSNFLLENTIINGGTTIAMYGGTSTIRNNKIDYIENPVNHIEYGIKLSSSSRNEDTVNIENNVINGYPRGLNIDTKNDITDVIVRNNVISNVTEVDRSAIQITRAKSSLIDNNILKGINTNVFRFHEAYTGTVTITNNKITDSTYLAVFGDDNNIVPIPNVVSSGNVVDVKNPGKGITKQGTIQNNGFTLN